MKKMQQGQIPDTKNSLELKLKVIKICYRLSPYTVHPSEVTSAICGLSF
jgi:hypothetical protein